jgi:hypothetical protein
VLYQAFSRRERDISQLDARAGSPPSAGDILQIEVSKGAALERCLRTWEQWAAELLESQISFPMLAWFRSQHANQSWLTALVLMLDSSAVISLCADEDLRSQAQFTFAMGRHALADTTAIFGLQPRSTRDRLPHVNFLDLRRCVARAAAPLAASRLDEHDLRELRNMYEPEAEALSSYFMMVLPSWLPVDESRENWKAHRPGRGIPFAVSDPFRKSEL